MTGKSCLVTGASSGIGKAIALQLSERGFNVFAVARRENKLKETQAQATNGKIDIIAADVATEEGRRKVSEAVEASTRKLTYVVQNAGIMGKVSLAMEISEDAWKNAFEVNVHAPLFLTQKLLPYMEPKSRILHIGSGAAHNAMHGWAAYCSTKAAFLMLYRCLANELKPRQIFVGSVRPGIIESPMQEEIRESTVENMEKVEMFRDLKKNEYKGADGDKPHPPPTDGLDTAANAAHFVDFLLTETTDEEFGREEWDIRETHHHSRWIK